MIQTIYDKITTNDMTDKETHDDNNITFRILQNNELIKLNQL
jgi:hypothetical protein